MSDNTPEIRFKGFTHAWEQRKLGEVVEFNPHSALPDSFEYVDLESVVGTSLISHRTEYKSSAPSRAQRLAQKGDVFFQTVRPYQMNNYLFDLTFDNYVFSTGYAQLRPKIVSYFLLSKLQEKSFVSTVLDYCTGTSYPSINSTDLANIDITITMEEAEQKFLLYTILSIQHICVCARKSLKIRHEIFAKLRIYLAINDIATVKMEFTTY